MSQSHEVFTAKMIALIESGTLPWQRPWTEGAGMPRKLGDAKHTPYRGANVWILRAQGYASPFWGTYAQIQAKGGYVRKGEKHTPVVFGKTYRNRADEEVFVLKHFQVYNTDQCEGVEVPVLPAIHTDHTPLERCEKVVGNYPNAPLLVHGDDRAYYRPRTDSVHLPALQRFPVRERYYSTLFHELTHSTGHMSRLNRASLSQAVRFGEPSYAKEELIAEMGAALLCGHTGIDNATIDQSAAYLKGWLQVFKGNTRLLVEAGSAAQKAVDYILGT